MPDNYIDRFLPPTADLTPEARRELDEISAGTRKDGPLPSLTAAVDAAISQKERLDRLAHRREVLSDSHKGLRVMRDVLELVDKQDVRELDDELRRVYFGAQCVMADVARLYGLNFYADRLPEFRHHLLGHVFPAGKPAAADDPDTPL